MYNRAIGRKLLGALAFAASLTVASGCTEPEVRRPHAIAVMSGGGQEGEVGAPLPREVAVQVTDSLGRSVSRVSVTFEIVTAPTPGFTSGSVTPASAETDGSGVARVRWTLGTAAGQQTLRAWMNPSVGASTSHVEVHATARPGPTAALRATHDQIVAVTAGDSTQIAVTGIDRYGNTTGSVGEVAWEVIDPTVARITRTELVTPSGGPPARVATVVGLKGGRAAIDARGPSGPAVRFDLRVYVGPGRDIAYESDGTIYLLSADGATTTSLGPGGDPSWSPDGRQIVFTVPGGITVPPGSPSASIYVMNADGSGRRPLTDPATLPGAIQPAWSPDGRKIAFVAPSYVSDPVVYAGNALFVMNADGSAPTRVFYTPHLCAASCNGVQRPTWSPDGTRIAYQLNSFRSTGFRGDVFVVNADGSGDRPLAASGDFEQEPAWSPDGRRVVFRSAPVTQLTTVGPTSLYAVNADGTGRERLTPASSTQSWDDLSPTWSPDGRIAFLRRPRTASGVADNYELFVVNADGTELRRVATIRHILRPAWRPTP